MNWPSTGFCRGCRTFADALCWGKFLQQSSNNSIALCIFCSFLDGLESPVSSFLNSFPTLLPEWTFQNANMSLAHVTHKKKLHSFASHLRHSLSKTNTIWYHLYVESKIWHKWTYLQNSNRLADIENRLVCQGGEGEGWDGMRDQQIHTSLYRMDKWQGPTV